MPGIILATESWECHKCTFTNSYGDYPDEDKEWKKEVPDLRCGGTQMCAGSNAHIRCGKCFNVLSDGSIDYHCDGTKVIKLNDVGLSLREEG
ncbi:uncharacterized protein L3040_006045 [Drepanopeziza brunnea f. sp. 'multigermtubi']|nr:hypothetical protein L3040_006045 [Drepanopeziza brunnea f. sp. 'multigermtubi']